MTRSHCLVCPCSGRFLHLVPGSPVLRSAQSWSFIQQWAQGGFESLDLFVFKSQPRSMSIASFLSTKDGSLRPILDFYLSQDFLPFTNLVDGILVFLYFSFMEILCRSADFRPLFLLNCSIISFLLRASFVWFLSSYRMSS